MAQQSRHVFEKIDSFQWLSYVLVLVHIPIKEA